MHTRIQAYDANPWKSWFAWYPVRIDGRWIWRAIVEWRFDVVGPYGRSRDVVAYRSVA
jgi:hypothetical protein